LAPTITQSAPIPSLRWRRIAWWLSVCLAFLLVGGPLGWRWLGKNVFTPNLEAALGRDDPGPQFDRSPEVDYPAVKKWIHLGADVNAKGGVGLTALYVAVGRRDRDFVLELLRRGAEANTSAGMKGWGSALDSACESFRSVDHEIIRALIRAGADPVEAGAMAGPLDRATGDANIEVMTLILDAGAAKSQERLDSSLLLASQLTAYSEDLARIGSPKTDATKRRAAMELLLSKGANPNAPSVYGYSTLQEAVRAAQVDSVRVLLAHGGDAKRKCPDGTSVIKLANDRRRLLPHRIDAIVKLLRAAGAKD
jgi:ankyrin repeat protein